MNRKLNLKNLDFRKKYLNIWYVNIKDINILK